MLQVTVMVIYSNTLIRLFDRGSGRVEGITLFPFIILRRDIKDTASAPYVINHEKIHIIQQGELLVIFFIIAYFYEYFSARLRGDTPGEAYRKISFEREAYTHMYDLKYLERRKFLAYRKMRGDRYV